MDEKLAKELDLRFFHENDYQRRQCPTCKDWFWTTDPSRTLCGDSTCVEYSFLGDPLTKKPLSLGGMREAFLGFFEANDHQRVPRNPVVPRWRDDIFLNIASIANYQPHVTSGEVPPPANPLVVSQPCIRLNDLANIGRSGRHFSCFEMMGHHAFNSSEWGEKYWTEDCVRYGVEFLTGTLGMDGQRITFKESVWSGGGNAGPCVEVFAGGLEVATLVFMGLEEHEEGEFEIKGDRYSRMDLRIIDTGWGLERLAWASSGEPTAYDTVFPETIGHLKSLAGVSIADDDHAKRIVSEHARVQGVLNLDIGTRLDKLRQEVVKRLAGHGVKTDVDELEKIMGPVENLYALADHLRCLSFMVGDGVVPSNVKSGYLMRLVLRRALRFKNALGIKAGLDELLVWNMEQMLSEFPEFRGALDRAGEIARLETERYVGSMERGMRLVERRLQKKKGLGLEDLVEFYDAHGIRPEAVAEAAEEKGVKVEIPDDFDMVVAERHAKVKKKKAKAIVPADVPATRRIFYEQEGQWHKEFDAKVTWVGDAPELEKGAPEKVQGHAVKDLRQVTLDASCFFHEAGGQLGDRGELVIEDGSRLPVVDVKKDGEHPVHWVADPKGLVKPGVKVQGIVDWALRMDHTRSHTATHIMNQSVRRVLGPHSWQAGTQKYQDCARVDMTHYRRPTLEEIAEIERLANQVVLQGRDVKRSWWNREEAEVKYGLQLLQGGIPKGREVRVVEIGPSQEDPEEPYFDVEYCGGTHCRSTNEVGPVKLWRTELVQDGVERFEYSAGLYAVDRWQETDEIVRESASALSVPPKELPKTVNRFFEEWKQQRKQIERLKQETAGLARGRLLEEAQMVGDVRVVASMMDLEIKDLIQVATELTANKKVAVVLASGSGGSGKIVVARSDDLDSVHAGKIVQEAAGVLGGKGGGRPNMAQGGGPEGAKAEAAVAKGVEVLKAQLG
jgi:alanyl-tRNA synthetase